MNVMGRCVRLQELASSLFWWWVFISAAIAVTTTAATFIDTERAVNVGRRIQYYRGRYDAFGDKVNFEHPCIFRCSKSINDDNNNNNDGEKKQLYDNQGFFSRKDFCTGIATATIPLTWANLLSGMSSIPASASDNAVASASWLTAVGSVSDETTTKLCSNGALIPEMAVPGAYNSACMNLPQRQLEFPSYYNKPDIQNMKVTIQQLTSGSGKTGMAVWNSGLLLSRLLVALVASNPPTTSNWWKQQRCIVELGCGTGLTSIVASKLGAPYVIATDGNPDVLQLTKSNIQLNDIRTADGIDDNADGSESIEPGIVETAELSWGLLNAMDYCDMANVIIGSDLTYNSGSWRVLAETMNTILKDDGVIIYLSLGHDGFNVRAELDEGFLSVAKSQGLIPVSELTIDNDGHSISLDQLLDRVVSPTETQQVLQPSGGARVVVLRKKLYLMKQQKKKLLLQQ